MIYKIVSLLLDVAAGLLAGGCILRLYMQYQRIPFGNPIGRFVFAITDWLVLPLRRVLPSVGKLDTASLVGAYLVQLVQFGILWALFGVPSSAAVLPLIALYGLLRLVISGLMGLMLIYAILSWVHADSPAVDVIERLCIPILRPIRRVLPPIGGVDLSPLVVLVLLQIVLFVVS